MKSRIIQIIPYFGKWPEYIDLYLYSCSKNPIIKFLFYTDCHPPRAALKYKNVEFRVISYVEYCKFVSSKLHIKFEDHRPYKLCDVRPFFGYLHKEDIADYEFWSYGDIDVCYGDLRQFLNDTNLKQYDVLTTQNYHVAGHCTVIRNRDYYNNLCFFIPNWKEKLLDKRTLALDELDMTTLLHPLLRYTVALYNKIFKKFFPNSFNTFIKYFNALVRPKMLLIDGKTSPEPIKGEVWRCCVSDWKVFNYNGEALPYLHFLFFKSHPDKSHDFWDEDYYQLSHEIENYDEIKFSVDGIVGLVKD